MNVTRFPIAAAVCSYLLLLSCARAQEAPAVDDGPYLFVEGTELVARSLVKGKAVREVVAADRTIAYTIEGVAKRIAIPKEPPDVPPAETKEVERLLVVSDPHGHAKGFVEVLRIHGVVDAALDWSYGKGHLAVVGDIFDRGDRVNEILWWLYQLEKQAAAAGGRVHVLLGNHEDFILRTSDGRYLHGRYEATEKALGMNYFALYGKGSVLGDWLRTRNVIEKIEGALYVHGGIDPALFTRKVELETLNGDYRAWLGGKKPGEEMAKQLESLLWFRGYFDGETSRPAQAEIDRVLGLFEAKQIVVGHTTQKEILPVYENARVIGVDAGRCQLGEALLQEKGVSTRCRKDGTKVLLTK
jgi:hypothetical protein